MPKQLVIFAAFSIKKWLEGKAGPGSGRSAAANNDNQVTSAPSGEEEIFSKFKDKFNNNIDWSKVSK